MFFKLCIMMQKHLGLLAGWLDTERAIINSDSRENEIKFDMIFRPNPEIFGLIFDLLHENCTKVLVEVS
jgi:hypothetical protein